MKIACLGAIFAIIFLTVIMAQRPTYEMSPMDWVHRQPDINLVIPVEAKKDLLLYIDISGPLPALVIRRRDNTGYYHHAANVTENPSLYFTTNGKWIAVYADFTALFTIDENNELSETSHIPLNSGLLLSDDTFVGFSLSTVDGVPSSFQTFEYDPVKNWTEIPDTRLDVIANVQLQGVFSTYQVTDTHLVYVDTSVPDNATVPIYQREADKSWTFVENVDINDTTILRVIFNGADTLVCTSVVTEQGVLGAFFTYTKINGEWVEQTFNGPSLGYEPMGFIGFVTYFHGPDTLFVSAGAEGFMDEGGPVEGGKVLMLTRNSQGLWEPAVDMIGSPGLLGLGLAINDYDIITPSVVDVTSGLTTKFFTAPLCFAEPMNVTCINEQVDDCSGLELDNLYTINNPQCGAVTVKLNSFGLVNNQALSAQLTFTRGYGADFSCNATVTCPAPPVAPVGSVAPIASTPSKNVSSATSLHFGIGSAMVLSALLLS